VYDHVCIIIAVGYCK